MTYPKKPTEERVIDELKASVSGQESFEVEKELPDSDLATVSGGECLCKCATDSIGGGPSCGGGGGGGRASDEEMT